MKTPRRTILVGALSCAVVAGAAPAPGETIRRRADAAAHFVATQQNDDGSFEGSFSAVGTAADAVLGLVSARRGETQINRAIGFMRRNLEEASYGQTAKIVLALVAAGRNPRDFANQNLVARLRAGRGPDGRYGTGPAIAQVTDHALAMLALAAARASIPRTAVEWLVDAQCPNGGWQFDDPYSEGDDDSCFNASAPSDFDAANTDTTAYAVMALVARPSTVPLRADPFAFFPLARDPHKDGWVYDPGFICADPPPTDLCSLSAANSTALAIQAYLAEGLPVPAGARAALTGLQYPLCGRLGGGFAIAYDPATGDRPAVGTPFLGRDLGATVGALPALLNRPLPLAPFKVRAGVSRPPAC